MRKAVCCLCSVLLTHTPVISQHAAVCPLRTALMTEVHSSCCAMQMEIMGGFNDALQVLSEEKEQLKGQHKEAAHAHARARKQLASIESTMREYEAVAQGQQQAIDEAQDKLAANSQVCNTMCTDLAVVD